jgi:hypothetical protein
MASPRDLDPAIVMSAPYYTEFGETALSAEEIAIANDRLYTRGAIVLGEALLNRGPSGSPGFWEGVVALHLANDHSIPCFIANRLGGMGNRGLASKAFEPPPERDLLVELLEEVASRAKQRSEDIKRTTTVARILDVLYSEGTHQSTSDGIYNMIGIVLKLMEDGKFEYLDGIFNDADPSRLTPEYLIGLLRATFVERSLIRRWTVFLARVEAELRARARTDIDELLQGLRTL